MMMPGRKYSTDEGYRYGFNGQEKGNEVKGNGNSYGAEFWEYDPRLGRRWNMDPKPNPTLSFYSCLGDNPIWFNDCLGDTLRAYSEETGNLIGTTYAKGENLALLVSKDRVEEVKQMLNGNETQKNNEFIQNMKEQALKGSVPALNVYGTLYDVKSLFEFYDQNALKYEATNFSDYNGKQIYFTDLKSATLNGKKVDLKNFHFKGTEVQGNLVYKNGIITMGVPENFRTAFSFNSQNSPVPSESNKTGTIHIHLGFTLDFKYTLKTPGNVSGSIKIRPNLMPTYPDDYLYSGTIIRSAVVSSDRLYLYTNKAGQEVQIERIIK